MHVDGFRFDLASALARSLHDVDKLSSFFDTIHQDPVISQVKLIAEPWDVGAGGYQVGEFPPLWTEWNGKYRDTVRSFWAHGRRRRARPGLPAVRLVRPLRRRRPAADRVDQLRHRARRLHHARPRLLRAQAQRGQRRGQPRRHRRQPLVQLRRRGRPGAAGRRAAAPAPGAQPALHAAAVDRRADAGRRRRACGAPSAATTTPTCQDNEISWLDWTPTEPADDMLGAGPAAARAAPERTRCCGRAPSSRASPVEGGDGCKDLAWFHPAGRELAERRLVRRRAADDRHVPRRPQAAPPQPPRRDRSSTSRSCCCCTPATTTAASTLPGPPVGARVRADRSTPPQPGGVPADAAPVAGGAGPADDGALGAAAAGAARLTPAHRGTAGRLGAMREPGRVLAHRHGRRARPRGARAARGGRLPGPARASSDRVPRPDQQLDLHPARPVGAAGALRPRRSPRSRSGRRRWPPPRSSPTSCPAAPPTSSARPA